MNIDLLREDLLSGNAQLFDVRELHEWEAGHLKDAIFVPLSELENNLMPNNLNKGIKTYLHCRSGVRVNRAAPILLKMGFTDVVPLPKGFEELVINGFERA